MGIKKSGRGQFQISFGMIFSIIIIIFTIAVAFFVIKEFLGVNKCVEIGSFYEDFQDKINSAWSSVISQGTYAGTLPTSIEYVCFTVPEKQYLGKTYSIQYNALKDTIQSFGTDESKNVFLYPGMGCKGNEYHNIEHINISEFFCTEVIDGKINIKFSKDTADALVKIENGN